MTKQEIYDLMNQNLGFFLATSEDDQPHVRGMMLFRANENGILSLLGLGKFYFDFDNRVTRYLSSRSFLFYIFHFGWLIAIQYFVSSVTSNVAIIALTSVVGGYILTFLWCEILLLLGKALRKVFSRETR